MRQRGSKRRPTETKKRTAKASRTGRASDAARRPNSDRPTTSPARNAPRAMDTSKSKADAHGDTESQHENGQSEQLARASRGHPVEQPRHHPPASEEDQGHHGDDLHRGQASRHGHAADPAPPGAKDGGKEYQRDDGEQILDDQPANRDVPGGRIQLSMVGQNPDKHDSTCHRDGQSEHNPGRPSPAAGERRPRSPVRLRQRFGPAPGTATLRTAMSCSTWNCSPTPNIRRTTPTSANCSARCLLATNPGVDGPTTTPASR